MAANQNVTQLTQQTGSAAASSLFYAVTGGTTDTGLPLSVLVNNLGLTGVPTAPTPGSVVNTTQIVTGAYVATYYAPLASPTFTGTPTLPTGTIAVTQSPGNSSTAVATTAFVAASFAPLASPTFTGVPAAPTASTGTSTTQVATTAFVANTFAAPPSYGATTPAAVHATTISATSTITPATTAGIVGTTLADSAQSGSVGEFISATIALGSAVALTSGTPANVTSISLTAGDWDVWGTVAYSPAGSTVVQNVFGSINTVSATLQGPTSGAYYYLPITFAAGIAPSLPVGTTRINVSSTTTVYLVAQSQFTTSTNAAYGGIFARRRR